MAMLATTDHAENAAEIDVGFEVFQNNMLSTHFTANSLSVEGITALALVDIHQLAAGVLDRSRGCVNAHKHPHIEVHTE